MSTRASSTDRSFRRRVAVASALALTTVGALVVATAGGAQAATSVGLGTADSFAILGGTGFTNTGPTTITGDVGSFPTAPVGGGALTIGGVNHGADLVTQGAKTDLVTAYNAAAAQATDVTISADLGGSTLVPGVYTSATSLGLTGTVTLDGLGSPDSVFVFQAGTTLTTGSGSRVLLTNGAQACNVFWQIGSSATLGTTTTFVGTIMAMASVTLNTSATIDGRALARTGAVTMDSNTVRRSQCSTGGSGVVAYAANVGPGAQGLVCPWGGQFDGVGLCSGVGSTTLTNSSATPTTASSATATPGGGASASASSVVASTPIATQPVRPGRPAVPVADLPGGGIRPSAAPNDDTPQVVATPSGGVDTGR